MRVRFRGNYSRHQFQPRPPGLLGVVLVGLGIPKVDQDAVAHVLRYEHRSAGQSLRRTFDRP